MSKFPSNVDFLAVEIVGDGERPIYLCIKDIINENKGRISFVIAKEFSDLTRDHYDTSIMCNEVDFVDVFEKHHEMSGQVDPDSVWLVVDGRTKKAKYFEARSSYADRWQAVFNMVHRIKGSKAKHVSVKESAFDRKISAAFPYTSGAVLISSGDKLDKLIKEAYTLGLKEAQEKSKNEQNSN